MIYYNICNGVPFRVLNMPSNIVNVRGALGLVGWFLGCFRDGWLWIWVSFPSDTHEVPMGP